MIGSFFTRLGSFATELADLLPTYLFAGRFATEGNESRGYDRSCLGNFDAPFVKAVKGTRVTWQEKMTTKILVRSIID